MPSRAIDFHVHLPTPDWLDGSMAGYVEAAEAYFRSSVTRQSLEELAAFYRGLEVTAVLLAWDAETATGRPRVPNETVAAACRDYPRRVHRPGLGRPAQGRVGRGRGGEHRRARAARGQVPSVAAGVRAGRPAVLADLRGLRTARAAGPVPHRDQRYRRPPARRPGHQDRPGPSHQARPGGRGAPGADRGGRALRLAVAHG